jgi:hypothetical protein
MMALNDHQLAAEKRLKSYEEHLRLIIPVSAVTIRLISLAVGILEGDWCSNLIGLRAQSRTSLNCVYHFKRFENIFFI